MYSEDDPSQKDTQSIRSTQSFSSTIAASPSPLLGAILSFPQTISAKIAARAGFQWVMIDMEHSPFSMGEVTEIVHIIATVSQGSCLPLVRIPSHGDEYIKWALDSGAAGILIPMVHNRQMMEGILSKALYPPKGQRSFGPYNAAFGDQNTRSFADYYEKAQAGAVAIIPIIESPDGVRNVKEILSLDGVSGAFLGPYDLRLSMGLPGGSNGSEVEFQAALKRVCSAGAELGKPIGSMGSGQELARERMLQGMKFLLVSFDHAALARGFKNDIEPAKRGVQRL